MICKTQQRLSDFIFFNEQSLINVMYEITTHLVEENGKKFDTHELDIFIELVRKFFDKQMKELQNKIA